MTQKGITPFCPLMSSQDDVDCRPDCRWWVPATDGAEDHDCAMNKIAAALDGLMHNADGATILLRGIEKALGGIKAEISAFNTPPAEGGKG